MTIREVSMVLLLAMFMSACGQAEPPVEDVERLLRERPKAKGLAVPGMPTGSPGMKDPSGKIALYEVYLIGEDGSATVFAQYGS